MKEYINKIVIPSDIFFIDTIAFEDIKKSTTQIESPYPQPTFVHDVSKTFVDNFIQTKQFEQEALDLLLDELNNVLAKVRFEYNHLLSFSVIFNFFSEEDNFSMKVTLSKMFVYLV